MPESKKENERAKVFITKYALVKKGMKVTVEVEGRFSPTWMVRLSRRYMYHLPVQAGSLKNLDEAFENATKLLQKVEAMEKRLGGPIVFHGQCGVLNRHHRELVFEDIYVSFKEVGGERPIVIQDMYREDADGYRIAESPYPLSDVVGNWTAKDDAGARGREICSEMPVLAEGEEIWYWDNISGLSGSAGIAVVKDGLILRTKGTLMA